MISALLEFSKKILAIEFPEEEMAKLKANLAKLPEGGCQLIFGPEKKENELFHNVFLFEQGCMLNREKMDGEGGMDNKNVEKNVGKNEEKEEKVDDKREEGKLEGAQGENNKTGIKYNNKI